MKRMQRDENSKKPRKMPPFDFQVVLEICLVCCLLLLLNQIRISRQTKEILDAVQSPQPSIFWYMPAETQGGDGTDAAPTEVKYVLNTTSMKIHSAECRYAVTMQQTNRREVYAEDIEQLLAEGYTICGVCQAKSAE